MRSTLDTLREWAGASDGPGVVDALRRVSDAAVDDIVELLLTSPPRPVRPTTA